RTAPGVRRTGAAPAWWRSGSSSCPDPSAQRCGVILVAPGTSAPQRVADRIVAPYAGLRRESLPPPDHRLQPTRSAAGSVALRGAGGGRAGGVRAPGREGGGSRLALQLGFSGADPPHARIGRRSLRPLLSPPGPVRDVAVPDRPCTPPRHPGAVPRLLGDRSLLRGGAAVAGPPKTPPPPRPPPAPRPPSPPPGPAYHPR